MYYSYVDNSFFIPLSYQPVYQVNTITNEYYHREEEHTAFATQGMVKTADGRELSFQLEIGKPVAGLRSEKLPAVIDHAVAVQVERQKTAARFQGRNLLI